MQVKFNNIIGMLLRNDSLKISLIKIPNSKSKKVDFLLTNILKSNFKQNSEEHIQRPFIILRLPFIGGHSLHVEKKLLLFLLRYLFGNFNLNDVHNC